MSEGDLIARAQAGDTDAFGELVDRYRSAVYRTVLCALHDRAEAEDVTQETFISAFNKLSTFRGESSFKTWVISIAWRRAIDQRRSLVKRVRRFVSGGEIGAHATWTDIAAPTKGQEQRLIDAEFGRQLRRLITALPHKLRDALLLAASGEHSYEEMAQMLHAPVGTIKSRVFEARRMLRHKLERRI